MQQIRSAEVRWEWISDAWKLFSSNPGTWIAMIFIVIAFVSVSVSPLFILGLGALIARGESIGMTAILSLGALFLLMIPIIILVLLTGGAFLTAGFFRTAIKQARGEDISVSDFFSGGDRLWPVVGYFLAVLLISIVIEMVLGIPGIISEELGWVMGLISNLVSIVVNGLLLFALPQIVDNRAGVIDALTNSFNLTKQYWWMYAILAFVTNLLAISGVILCFVGIVITAHFAVTIPAVAYRDVFGLAGARSYEQFPTPPPPPNYWETPPQPELTGAQPYPQPAPVTCRTCGATLTRATNFCNQCGSRLELG